VRLINLCLNPGEGQGDTRVPHSTKTPFYYVSSLFGPGMRDLNTEGRAQGQDTILGKLLSSGVRKGDMDDEHVHVILLGHDGKQMLYFISVM